MPAATRPGPGGPEFEQLSERQLSSTAKALLASGVKELSKAQELLWASDTYAMLVVFQALDAAGKDSTIEHVMSGVNPQGVHVVSFKQPSGNATAGVLLRDPNYSRRPAPEGGTMLLVVRHADAGDKRSWTGSDRLRPLSPGGYLQAEGLVVRLEDYPIDRILCSPTLRCYQTVEPLARDRLLQIETAPALGVDTTPAQLLALFWDLELRNSVLCTHGEGIGLLLTRLIAGALLVEDTLDWPKGSTWLLERVNRRQVRGRFLGPLVLNGTPTKS